MRKGFKEIKRKIKRIVEEIGATKEISRYTSIVDAILTFVAKFDIQVMCRNGFKEPENVKKRLLSKHRVMMEYLEKKYSSYWRNYKYSYNDILGCTNKYTNKYKNKIWVCWWQGIESAPEIVKRCIDSIKENAGNYEVIIITEENRTKFVDFPDYIIDKVKRGIISKTIFSDLLRINLLSRYGGIWLDSTFFVCGDLSKYVEKPFWSIKRPDYLHASIAGGNFSNYSLGCSFENRWFFKIVLDFLYFYWKENNMLIDYLLTDYVIVLTQNHNVKAKELFKSIEPNNEYCDECAKILNQPYDRNIWNRISSTTDLFKLSWKSNFIKTSDGRPTFYCHLIDRNLNK